MRAPLSWIREFVAIPREADGRSVAERLVAAGLEVETVITPGSEVSGPLVVGQVLEIEELSGFRKPIRFARVAVGAGNGEQVGDSAGSERGVICGASNFAVADLVVVALPGAVLPGGFEIASRMTYGRLSDGMIVSERELGLGDDHSGIIVLPPGSGAPGDSGYEVLGLGDPVLDIAVTPDRGYALSIRGLAREAATAFGLPFNDPALSDPESILPEPVPGSSAGPVHECQISDPTGADRFVLRSITGLNPRAHSPQWMRRRLVACGMRPVSLAVDVTNYVMLELGQPLHAFDRSKLAGPLQVRRALPGERLETLDHVQRVLDPQDLLIADQSRPLALAGTMGGLDSEIDSDSSEVAIEAVHFNAEVVARMSRRHRLSSEASRRFERGVDPELPAIASARAVALLCQYGSAGYVGVSRVDAVSSPGAITISGQYPAELSGVAISAERAAALLDSVGCRVAALAGGQGGLLEVVPPSWRPDLTDPADLAEEVIRLVGYEQLPGTLPRARAGFGLTADQRLRRRVGRQLAGSGLTEVLSYPFLALGEIEALGIPSGGAGAPEDPRRQLVRLANPLSDESPYLRTTLLPGLIAAARRNLARGAAELALFEVGLVFRGESVGTLADPPRPSVAGPPSPTEIDGLFALLPDQPRQVAVLLAGAAERAGWWGPGRSCDWADAIGICRDLAAELGVTLTVSAATMAPWHPGRCAQLELAGDVIGHAGELHPRAVAAAGLPPRTCVAELDLDALLAAVPAVAPAPPVPIYPVAKEDLALVVPVEVRAADLQLAVAQGAGEYLEAIRLFDVYTGSQVSPGHKSLAFSLRLRAADRTLGTAEVAAARAGALAQAAAVCGATLRE